MKIRISEVWNYTGESKELAIIEADVSMAAHVVIGWISVNRPDLELADTTSKHGFHAIAVIDG